MSNIEPSIFSENSSKSSYNSDAKETRSFYIAWIVIIIIGYVVILIINIIFVYVPISRIEEKAVQVLNKALNLEDSISKVVIDVDVAARGVERLINTIEPTLNRLEDVYCNFFSNDSFCINRRSNTFSN
uniref:Transmembrane protein n=1 Tax=Pithovirus LCPAC104 TaxID=2506589 RepID=A0A481Z577_9VIRU|nr:MAG: uncharacterized protein LCPAC104_00780 [Pithovirus LCPAC104]